MSGARRPVRTFWPGRPAGNEDNRSSSSSGSESTCDAAPQEHKPRACSPVQSTLKHASLARDLRAADALQKRAAEKDSRSGVLEDSQSDNDEAGSASRTEASESAESSSSFDEAEQEAAYQQTMKSLGAPAYVEAKQRMSELEYDKEAERLRRMDEDVRRAQELRASFARQIVEREAKHSVEETDTYSKGQVDDTDTADDYAREFAAWKVRERARILRDHYPDLVQDMPSASESHAYEQK